MSQHHAHRALTHLEGARDRIGLCPIDPELRLRLSDALDQIEDELCGAMGVDADRARVRSVIGRNGAQVWAQRNLVIGGSGWSSLGDIYGAYVSNTGHPVSQKQFAAILSDVGVQRRIGASADGHRRRLWRVRLRTDTTSAPSG